MVFVVIVTEAVPLTLLRAALMVADPEATPVASPEELIVATEAFEDVHVTEDVTSPVVPSVYVAVAWNCCVEPAAKLVLAGVTAIDDTVADAEPTVRVAFPLTPLSVAVMVAEPAATPVASPAELMVATAVLEELQVT